MLFDAPPVEPNPDLVRPSVATIDVSSDNKLMTPQTSILPPEFITLCLCTLDRIRQGLFPMTSVIRALFATESYLKHYLFPGKYFSAAPRQFGLDDTLVTWKHSYPILMTVLPCVRQPDTYRNSTSVIYPRLA